MKLVKAANVVILVILLVNAIIRDVEYQKEGAGDLRNRVVGARLTKDGRDPYFYKWKTGDSYRYLDYGNVNTNVVSIMTATPLFHHLMAPLCDFDERTIAYAWFILEYLALLVIIAAGVVLCTGALQKIVVLNTGVLFAYTNAWMFHLVEGQMYIFIAALIMIIVLFITRYNSRKSFLIFAGVLTAILIFIRPIAAIILLPFIFSPSKYKVYLMATILFSVAYAGYILTNENEKKQWTNYSYAMDKQVKIHQNLEDSAIKIEKPPVLKYLEGDNLEEQRKAFIGHPFPYHSENGNVFFVFKTFTRAAMPLSVLYSLYFVAVLFLSALAWRKYKKNVLNERRLVLFGLILYMVTELYTPVHRHQYNTVQWLPLILLAISIHKRPVNFSYLLIFAGILLNISNTQLIPMRHTIGEYIILTGLLLIVFIQRGEENKGKQLLSQDERLVARSV